MDEDCCSLLNSDGVAWVGPLASPLEVEGAPGIVYASDGGNALDGAATEGAESSAGVGGASAFLQPSSNVTRKAETKTERVKDISTS